MDILFQYLLMELALQKKDNLIIFDMLILLEEKVFILITTDYLAP